MVALTAEVVDIDRSIEEEVGESNPYASVEIGERVGLVGGADVIVVVDVPQRTIYLVNLPTSPIYLTSLC